MTVQILHGDCRDVLRTLADASVDSVVTDPPYELGFMGKKWDRTGVANDVRVWAECLRVLKPGGHLVAFGGTRTYHRMVCAIEDAGFDVRDQLSWLYGSGFPKSHNLGGDWQGWGTALKPAWEPIVLARKPLVGTVAENVLQHGTGAMNIDGCRVEAGEGRPLIESKAEKSLHAFGDGLNGSRFAGTTTLGRWPANIVHDGSEEVVALFPGDRLGMSSGGNGARDVSMFGVGGVSKPEHFRADTGSAARFFYCAKADRADRNAGLAQNNHPTVKPTDLMRWLCRLITPPGGTVLDPFMGSGSTLKAAELEGFSAIGIELESEYIEIARRRIASDAPLFAEVSA